MRWDGLVKLICTDHRINQFLLGVHSLFLFFSLMDPSYWAPLGIWCCRKWLSCILHWPELSLLFCYNRVGNYVLQTLLDNSSQYPSPLAMVVVVARLTLEVDCHGEEWRQTNQVNKILKQFILLVKVHSVKNKGVHLLGTVIQTFILFPINNRESLLKVSY